jgi:hypothetical protein
MKKLLHNTTQLGVALAITLTVVVGGVGVSLLHAFQTLA